jgi:hypothetical protein
LIVKVMVFVLFTLQSVALTVVDVPEVPIRSTVPSLTVSTVESPTFQVTMLVTGVPAAPPTVAVAATVRTPPEGPLVPLGAVSVRLLTTGQTFTVAVVVAVIAPSLALIVVEPIEVALAVAVTSPVVCPIVATDESDEDQMDLPVTTSVLPSSNVPVATIW